MPLFTLRSCRAVSKHAPDTSEEFLRREIEDAAKRLAPAKIAIFECARVDKSRPQEEVMKTLLKLRDEGLFQHIGLSECSAETIRKSHAVAPCVRAFAAPSLTGVASTASRSSTRTGRSTSSATAFCRPARSSALPFSPTACVWHLLAELTRPASRQGLPDR